MKLRPALRPALICLIYFGLLFGAQVAMIAITPQIHFGIGPEAGLSVALLMIGGPAYGIAVLAGNLATYFLFPHTLTVPWMRLAFPVAKTLGYTLTAWLVHRRLGSAPIPRNRRESGLLVLAAFAAPLPWALIASFGLNEIGHTLVAGPWTDTAFRVMVAASAIFSIVPAATLFVAPWFLGQYGGPAPKAHPSRRMESLFQAASLLLTFWLVQVSPTLHAYHGFPIYFVVLVWIALSRGLPGATVAILTIFAGNFLGLCMANPDPSGTGDFVLFSLAFAGVGLGLGTVVTLRKRAEAALAESQDRLARVHGGARLGLWDCDLVNRRVTYDQGWADILDYRLEEIPSELGWWEPRIHPDDRTRVEALLAEHFAGQTPFYEAEFRFRTGNGGWKWVYARGSITARDAKGKPLHFAGTQLDLTDRKLAESEKNRLLNIIEASTDFIVTASLDYRVQYANPALLALRGLPRLPMPRGLPLARFHPEWAAKRILQEGLPAAMAKGIWVGESALLDGAGREVPVSQLIILQRDDAGRPATFSTIMRDISKQKEMEGERLAHERRLLEAQKLESLGVLAGGIAHDFNNLLTVMLGNVSLAQFDLPPDSPISRELQQVRESALRAADLCKQLLAYSGKGQFSTALVDLSALVEDTTKLLHVSISRRSTVKFDLSRSLPPVQVDPVQIRQIVMNLVMNASDAIGEESGRIRITTGLAPLDAATQAEAYPAAKLPPGDYVFLEVADNGAGMTPEVKARIFEPFFSTKFAGRGLGLAAVLGIVRGHRGALTVTSSPGRGSAFRLFLPAAAGVAAAPPAPAVPATPPVPKQPQGTILVVDDEESVRTISGYILESCGYSTVLAANGREALKIFRAAPEKFTAILLDLTMPEMNGEEMLRELRRLNYPVPVVLMSGYTEEESGVRLARDRYSAFIPKPFDRNALAAKLAAVITSAGA